MPLKVEVEDVEFFNGVTSEFFTIKGGVFSFEHSLLSLSEWESKYKKPLLDKKDKTIAEFADYIMMMELSGTLDQRLINTDLINTLSSYIVDTPSATVIKSNESSHGSSFITSESIYASMAMSQVPFTSETWNLNRLLNVLAIIGEKSNPKKKKKTMNQTMSDYRSLNAQRRAASGGKG